MSYESLGLACDLQVQQFAHGASTFPLSKVKVWPAPDTGRNNTSKPFKIDPQSLKNLKTLKKQVFRNFLGPYVSDLALLKDFNISFNISPHVHKPFLRTYPIIAVLTHLHRLVVEVLRERRVDSLAHSLFCFSLLHHHFGHGRAGDVAPR